MDNLLIIDIDDVLSSKKEQISFETASKIITICNYADIHLVSVNTMPMTVYKIQPLMEMFNNLSANKQIISKLSVSSCNGSQNLCLNDNHDFVLSKMDMINFLSQSKYNDLVSLVLQTQQSAMKLINKYSSKDLRFTGNFLDYRSGYLNWCPIGMNSEIENIQEFIALDKKEFIREQLGYQLEQAFYFKDINDYSVSLINDYSIAVYPKYWDKSQILKNIDHSKYKSIRLIANQPIENNSFPFLNSGLVIKVGNMKNGKCYVPSSLAEGLKIIDSWNIDLFFN